MKPDSSSNPDSTTSSTPKSPKWPHLQLKAFSVRNEPRIGVLRFVGDYEMSLFLFHGRDLISPVKAFMGRGYEYVVIDFSESTCFDHPYGIGPILECRNSTARAGGSFRIVTTRWLDEWMQMIGYDRFFGEFIANSVQDAVRDLTVEIARHDRRVSRDPGAT